MGEVDPLSTGPVSTTASIPATTTIAGRGFPLGGLLRPSGFERPRWHSFAEARRELTVEHHDAPNRFTIAIDPGHGGSDPGATGPNGLLEKHLTLDIAWRVRLFLSESDDLRVMLTRQRDRGLSRRDRVTAVRGSGADLFVSLHFNHLPQREITLVESFYAAPENVLESLESQAAESKAALSEPDSRAVAHEPRTLPDLSFTRGSARFAALAQRRVVAEVGLDNEDVLDAGTKRKTLFVLTRSLTSGALVELTCLSNAEEAERLTDSGYRDRIAAALADAIRDYRASLETDPLDEGV